MFTQNPQERTCQPLPIVRAKPKRVLRFVCCCRDWVGVNTHYWGGHTIVCTNTADCKPCMANMVPRWQGFIFGLSEQTQNHAIVQITPGVLDALDDAKRGDRGLLGARINMFRESSRLNGPLRCQVFGYDDSVAELTVKHLERALERIFKMNSGTVDGGLRAEQSL